MQTLTQLLTVISYSEKITMTCVHIQPPTNILSEQEMIPSNLRSRRPILTGNYIIVNIKIILCLHSL